MKKIVFMREKFPHKLHTLIVSLNMDAELVFDDGEYGDDGREVNDHLTVRVDHKKRVLSLLCQTFNGVSNTCGEAADERLFCALERVARRGHWRSLNEVERWLMDQGVPFTKRRRVEDK
jgi:hypothetical protein